MKNREENICPRWQLNHNSLRTRLPHNQSEQLMATMMLQPTTSSVSHTLPRTLGARACPRAAISSNPSGANTNSNFAMATSRISNGASRRPSVSGLSLAGGRQLGAAQPVGRCGVRHVTASLRRRRAGGSVSRPRVVTAMAVGPNEVSELAGSLMMTLSGAETLLGKVSFGSLLTATSIYEYKVSRC